MERRGAEADVKESAGKERLPVRGYLFLVATAFFTALSYAIGKALDRSDLHPETTTFFWFFGAFLVALALFPFLRSQRRELRRIRKYRDIFIWSSVLTSAGAALWMVSLWTIGPALTSFLMKAQTLFALLLGVAFLGERLNRWESVGIAMTIAGGVVVAYQREGYLIFGTAMALLSALLYSLLSFMVKKIAQDLNMLMVATLRALGVSIVLFVYLAVTGTFEPPGLGQAMAMACGGACGAYIAKASQFHSIKLLDISRTTAVMPMESIFVLIFAHFLFDDLPSATKLLGGASIMVGVVFLVLFRGRRNDILGK